MQGQIPIFGFKHPTKFGTSYEEAWPEVWKDVKDFFDSSMATAARALHPSTPLFMQRSSFVEECYLTFAHIPVYSDDGRVGGVVAFTMDVTGHVVGERRLLILDQLGVACSAVSTVTEVCDTFTDVLSQKKEDIAYSLVYLLKVCIMT